MKRVHHPAGVGVAVCLAMLGFGSDRLEPYVDKSTYVVGPADRAAYRQLMDKVLQSSGTTDQFGRHWLIERRPCELEDRWERDGTTLGEIFNVSHIDMTHLNPRDNFLSLRCEQDGTRYGVVCFRRYQVNPLEKWVVGNNGHGLNLKPGTALTVAMALTRLHAICVSARR